MSYKCGQLKIQMNGWKILATSATISVTNKHSYYLGCCIEKSKDQKEPQKKPLLKL